MPAFMPALQPYEDAALLTLLSEDNEYAFQLLFDRYRNRVYKTAMLYVRSPALADDIVQDVFLKIWFQRRTLPQIESLESWIFILTRNLTINCLKKLAHEWKARSQWVHEQDQLQESAELRLQQSQFAGLLQQAIKELPGQQQKIYRMVREQQLSYESVAARLSISPLTVKTHMARALASMRSFMLRHGREFLFLFLLNVATP